MAILHFSIAEIDLTVVFIEMYRIAETPTLTAIPLFALTGFLLAESGAPSRLVRFSQALLGWLPGGLAIMAIVVCALFTALTGASGMTIVALGGLLLPALRQQRLPDSFSLGLITTSGSLGLLFPPSLPLIIYGIVSETPVDQLFIAGIIPGLLLVGALSCYSLFQGRRCAAPERPTGWRELPQAFVACSWELLLPVVIFGGILRGDNRRQRSRGLKRPVRFSGGGANPPRNPPSGNCRRSSATAWYSSAAFSSSWPQPWPIPITSLMRKFQRAYSPI